MKPARDFVVLLVEFAAGVEFGHNKLKSRDALLGMEADRDPATVVLDAYYIVFFQNYDDVGAVARQSFIDRVVDDFINEVMQAIDTCRTDVHPWALSDRLESLKHLDTISRIGRFHNRPDGKGRRRDVVALWQSHEKRLPPLAFGVYSH